MAFDSLSEYIHTLESVGKLHRVKAEVDTNLEIAEIMRRKMYSGESPAILFENVKGYDIPILGNAFGTMDLLKIALNLSDFREIGKRITDLTKLKIPSNLFEKLKMLPRLSELGDYAPKYVESGAVTEIIETEKANLNSLPILKSFPNDAGKFITFGLTITKHPETGIRNIGVYRIQIVNDQKAIIGTDPSTIFSGIAPVPEGMDKFFFSGIVRKKGAKLIKCKTVDLEVPANSEIILEGYVDPNEMRIEGPFGDHTGFYTPPEPYPTFNLTCLMRRKNPIYLTTVVGKPILEDAYIGKVIEQSFLPLIQMFQPEVIDFSMPASGWFQGLAIISIKKRYPGQAKKVMMGLWGMGQLSLTKIFVVVDHAINVHNINEVIWAITTKSDPKRDIIIIDNTPTDTLDPASPILNLGSKMGIDATTKTAEEGFMREIQKPVEVDKETKNLVDKKWTNYGFSK
jgi:4-hydroxy-3-polyprenylbenzoate decarboxylase